MEILKASVSSRTTSSGLIHASESLKERKGPLGFSQCPMTDRANSGLEPWPGLSPQAAGTEAGYTVEKQKRRKEEKGTEKGYFKK